MQGVLRLQERIHDLETKASLSDMWYASWLNPRSSALTSYRSNILLSLRVEYHQGDSVWSGRNGPGLQPLSREAG